MRTMTLVLASTLLLPACTRDAAIPAPTHASESPSTDAAKPPADAAAVKSSPANDGDGRYTALSGPGCRTEPLHDELGSTRTVCTGIAPYRLIVGDGDARQSLDVVANDGPPQSLELAAKVGPGFSELGETLEWWPMHDAPPTALIARYNVHEHPDTPDRVTSYLVVAKLQSGQGSCVTDVIAPGPQQNARAREAAARAATAACRANRG